MKDAAHVKAVERSIDRRSDISLCDPKYILSLSYLRCGTLSALLPKVQCAGCVDDLKPPVARVRIPVYLRVDCWE
jgi:hypothetical protein